jgi:mycoredoxin
VLLRGITTVTENEIIMYGTSWCGDCARARYFLQEYGIAYQEIDVDEDKEAAVLVERLNGGYRRVPTIIFGDGSVLVEPSWAQLADKLGVML